MKYSAGTILLICLVLPSCNGGGSAAPEADAAPRAALVESLRLAPRDVSDTARLAADLRPRRRATLAAEVGGVVEELSVRLGDAVRKDEVVARIDTRALEQQLAEAQALYDQAVDRATRAESLFARRSITEQQKVDAVASQEVAAARLASARLALEKSEVKAPWNGRVAKRWAEEGDFASPGQPLVELVEVARLIVAASAPASEVPFLEVGKPVRVSVDVFPGETFEGEVVRLGAELDPSTRTLALEAELPNPDGRLRPGLFGRIEYPRRVLEQSLVVPLASIVDFETRRVVYVIEDGRAERRDVTLGPTIGEDVVVLAGLEAGDQVIVRGLQSVADGQPVTESGG